MAKRQHRRERNKPAAPARSPLMPLYAILGVIAVVGVGVLLYQGFGRAQPALEPVPVAMDPAELARVPGVGMGPEEAPVVIYEFADFQCPACAQFASFYAPLLKQRFVDTGQVRYVYYDFPLTAIHPHAFLASRAARCAGEQDRFWEYHDVLYGRQSSWSRLNNALPTFVDYADEVGADRGEFEACVRSDRYALEVTQNLRLGESLGVQGTPTLFINGRRLPTIPAYRDLEQMIQRELEAGQAAAAGTPATEPDQTGRETPGIP